jgi:hypothetical protein
VNFAELHALFREGGEAGQHAGRVNLKIYHDHLHRKRREREVRRHLHDLSPSFALFRPLALYSLLHSTAHDTTRHDTTRTMARHDTRASHTLTQLSSFLSGSSGSCRNSCSAAGNKPSATDRPGRPRPPLVPTLHQPPPTPLAHRTTHTTRHDTRAQLGQRG